MATKKQKNFRLAWGKRFGLDYLQVEKLLGLVGKAAKAQELEHNSANAADSTPAIEAVEAYAKSLGFQSISWPGLYPLLYKNGHNIDLPE